MRLATVLAYAALLAAVLIPFTGTAALGPVAALAAAALARVSWAKRH